MLEIAQGIDALSDSTVRAAYLIGISDPSSVAAVPGLVDASVFVKYATEIESAIAQLVSPSSNQQAIMAAAGIIAKTTAAMCN